MTVGLIKSRSLASNLTVRVFPLTLHEAELRGILFTPGEAAAADCKFTCYGANTVL